VGCCPPKRAPLSFPSMAKSLRSKVKKRLRTVKRGVIKKELATAGSKLNVREVAKEEKLKEALAGHLKPPERRRNAFRSDDPDAVIPHHNWRQGPDFRSGSVPESGYAVWGSNRPKVGQHGGDAPTARPVLAPSKAATGADLAAAADPGLARLLRSTEQIVPMGSSKKVRQRLKNKSGVDHNAAFRWA